MTQMVKSSNNLTLWLLLLMFACPFVLGSVAFKYREHFNFTSKQHGNLIYSQYTFSDLANFSAQRVSYSTLQNKWSLIYLREKSCDAKCQTNQQLLNNIHVALFKEQHRVQLLTASAVKEQSYPMGSVLLIDPKGYAMMHYSNILQENPSGILKDVRHLLKVSKVG